MTELTPLPRPIIWRDNTDLLPLVDDLKEIIGQFHPYAASRPSWDRAASIVGFGVLDAIDAYLEGVQVEKNENFTREVDAWFRRLQYVMRTVKSQLYEANPPEMFRVSGSGRHPNREVCDWIESDTLSKFLADRINLTYEEFVELIDEFERYNLGREDGYSTVGFVRTVMRGPWAKSSEVVRETFGKLAQSGHWQGCKGDLRYTDAWLELNQYRVGDWVGREAGMDCDCHVLLFAWDEQRQADIDVRADWAREDWIDAE